MKKTLIFGSAGLLARNYVESYPKNNYLFLDKRNINNFDENNTECFRFDIESNHDQQSLVEYCEKNEVLIEGIIFFQGINFMNNFFSVSSKEWDSTISINVKSIVFTLKYLYPYIADKCSIVVIASQNGVIGHKDRIDYGTSKAALIHLVKNLSIEFSGIKDKDIKINAVSPGYIYADKSKAYLDSPKGEILKNKIPYKKFVLPNDVSNAVHYLMSDESKAIRGQNIILDYGYTLI